MSFQNSIQIFDFDGWEYIGSVGDHLLSVHDGADADRERLFGHLRDVVAEETLVGLQRVVGQRLDARARHQRRARLVERDVPVGPDPCPITDTYVDSTTTHL